MYTVELRQAPVTPEQVTVAEKVLIIDARSWKSDQIGKSGVSSGGSYGTYMKDVFLKAEDLHKDGVPDFDFIEMPLEHKKLSPDQDPTDWVALAKAVEFHYEKYAGFVIINGTDTITMCATALSFMLRNLGKAVVFTGSMISADCIYTDLKRNTIIALTVAQNPDVCEVCILFDEQLFRANRTIRVAASHLCPYDSPHFPVLASFSSGELRLRRSLLRPFPRAKLSVFSKMDTDILVLQLGPGLEQRVLQRFVEKTKAKAIIIYCYGSGNGPTRDGYFRKALLAAKKRDVLVVICTQNRYGSVKLEEYEGGRQIMEDGGVGVGHMTHETVFTKLKYLFGLGYSTAEVRKKLMIDLRGEIRPLISRL